MRWLTWAGLLAAASCGTSNEVALRPLADAGFDQIANLGQTVTLDGSQSRDAAGGTLAFDWQLIARPSGSTASLESATTASPELTVDVEGLYLVELVVTNDDRESAPDLALVTASNRPPTVLVRCGASNNCNVVHGHAAQLSAATSFDPDNSSATLDYLWEQITSDCSTACPDLTACSANSTPVTLTNPTQAIASFSAPQMQSVDLVFRVTVDDAVSSSSACLVYHVTNLAPLVVFSPTNPSTASTGATFSLSGVNSGDQDGDSLTFHWTQTSGPAAVINSLNNATTSITAPGTAGTVQFRLDVSDGLATSSNTATVVVN